MYKTFCFFVVGIVLCGVAHDGYGARRHYRRGYWNRFTGPIVAPPHRGSVKPPRYCSCMRPMPVCEKCQGALVLAG